MAQQKITLQKIAELAGVSLGSVSRVLNHQAGISEATRKRIQKIINETGYVPSVIGQALAKGRSMNVLLQVMNVTDPYYANVSKQISRCLRKKGYRTILGNSEGNATLEREHLLGNLNGSVDGMIVSPIFSEKNLSLYQSLLEQRFPILLLDNPIGDLPIPCVRYDDYLGARLMMDHLISQGHRHILFLQDKTNFVTIKDRCRGYIDGLQAHGIPFVPERIHVIPHEVYHWDGQSLETLLRGPQAPTAVFASNEIIAIFCINVILRVGLKVPDDVAVAGVNDAISPLLSPISLTTISLQMEKACQQAVDALLQLIESPERRTLFPQTYIQKPKLIVRSSA